jgi:hypothetical protein
MGVRSESSANSQQAAERGGASKVTLGARRGPGAVAANGGSDRQARASRMKEEMLERDARTDARRAAASGAEPSDAPTLQTLPFFKVNDAEAPQLQPAGLQPKSASPAPFALLSRQTSLEDMARSCASPTPFGVNGSGPLPWEVATANQHAATTTNAAAAAAAVAATTTTAAAAKHRSGSPTLFDREQSATKPTRRPSLVHNNPGEVAPPSEGGVSQIPEYAEVKVERFGWRRRSFVSRANSPLLARVA